MAHHRIGAAAALVLLLGVQSAFAFSWQPCGEGKADISTVSLTPESPEPGVTVQFAIKGTASAHPGPCALLPAASTCGRQNCTDTWLHLCDLCDAELPPTPSPPLQTCIKQLEASSDTVCLPRGKGCFP